MPLVGDVCNFSQEEDDSLEDGMIEAKLDLNSSNLSY